MRRHCSGDEAHLLQAEHVGQLLGKPQVGEVNRIERAAENGERGL